MNEEANNISRPSVDEMLLNHGCQLQLFIKQVAGAVFCCFIHKKLRLTDEITQEQQFLVNEMSKYIFASDFQAKLNRYQLTTSLLFSSLPPPGSMAARWTMEVVLEVVCRPAAGD